MPDVAYDLVVVGSGAAGMTAALTAAHHGLTVLVVEKSSYFGGSTARSGGGVWIPNNEVLADAGIPDSPEDARRYLAHIVGDGSPAEVQRAFLDQGRPRMLSFVLAHTPLRFTWVPGYSDYHPEAPGGRPARVEVSHDGRPALIRARRGVVLTCGVDGRRTGEHRRRDRGRGTARGRGRRDGRRLVGTVDPTAPGPYFCLAERTLPGCMMVNAQGERFVNEAAPYVDAVHAMSGSGTGPAENIPTWLVADQRYRNRYVFAGLGPRQPFPGRWYASGVVRRATTLSGLAERIGGAG